MFSLNFGLCFLDGLFLSRRFSSFDNLFFFSLSFNNLYFGNLFFNWFCLGFSGFLFCLFFNCIISISFLYLCFRLGSDLFSLGLRLFILLFFRDLTFILSWFLNFGSVSSS